MTRRFSYNFGISGSAALFMTFLMSCGNEISKSKFILNLLNQKVNLQLKDSIIDLATEDTGIDLHGSWSETYIATISNNDLANVINKIEDDTTHGWIKTDIGDYITTLYPDDYRDTVLSIGIIKSKSAIDINIRQGL